MSQLSLAITPEQERSRGPRGLLTAVIPPLEGEFLYQFDTAQHPDLGVGDVIQVSLGRRITSAFIISVNSEKELNAERSMTERSIAIKSISAEAFTAHAFNPDHLEFFIWVAKYYAEPLSKILDVAIPTPSFTRPIAAYEITDTGRTHTGKLTDLQRSVLATLRDAPHPLSASDLQAQCGASPAVCSNLAKKELIARVALSRDLHPTRFSSESKWTPAALNEEQVTAVEAIVPAVQNSTFSTFLLQGVTGSGKTEVYLEAIAECLRQGRQCLILLPEIALSSQWLERFERRFGCGGRRR
jgi:primosomal protein N' (replication factor Y)